MGKRLNVTITLEETVARWVRVRAAERGTSVSRLVGELLRERMAEETGYEIAMNRYLGRSAVPLKVPGERYPERDQVHERGRLFR